MGLLTTLIVRGGSSQEVSRYLPRFTLLLYAVAIYLVVTSPQYTKSTYFSENALMPMSARPSFSSSHAERDVISLQSSFSSLKDGEQRLSFISKKLGDINIDPHVQTFEGGTNIYGLVRAQKTSGADAMLIIAPLPGSDSNSRSSAYSIPFVLGFVNHLKKSAGMWLSKDVIVLFADGEKGLNKWLNGYYLNGENSLECETSGLIHSALIFDLNVPTFDSLNVLMEGKKGQMPNLDFYNLIVASSGHKGIPAGPKTSDSIDIVLDKVLDVFGVKTLDPALRRLLTSALNQAFGVGTGMHSLCLSHHINAVTLESPSTPSLRYMHSRQGHERSQLVHNTWGNMGDFTESITRSVNNLLETFHQSWFQYVLDGQRKFIPVGDVSIVIGCCLVGIMLLAISGISSRSGAKVTNIQKKKKKGGDENIKKGSTLAQKPRPLRPLVSNVAFAASLMSVGSIALWSVAPIAELGLDPLYALILAHILFLISSFFIMRTFLCFESVSLDLAFFCMLSLISMVNCIFFMSNLSMGLVCVLWTGFGIFFRPLPPSRKILNVVQVFVFLFLSPPAIVAFLGYILLDDRSLFSKIADLFVKEGRLSTLVVSFNLLVWMPMGVILIPWLLRTKTNMPKRTITKKKTNETGKMAKKEGTSVVVGDDGDGQNEKDE